MSTQQGSGKIVTNDLIFYVDSYNTKSYDRVGSTWNDLSGNKLFGTIIGATYSINSFSFSGSSDYINVPSTTKLSPRTGNLTTSAWFPTTDSPGSNSNIISNYAPSPAKSFYGIYEQASGLLLGYLRDSANNAIVLQGTVVINDDKWHNVTLVRSGTIGYLYLDGVLDITSNNASFSDIDLDGNSLNIGRNSASNGQYFKGNIQTTYYYNRDLTASEVLQNYNALKPRFKN
jgi:hypothetical protein